MAGWRAYRADSLDVAARQFTRALELCSANIDAVIGGGYIALRQGRLAMADSLFRVATSRDSLNADGWDGLARASDRAGDHMSALRSARRLIALEPANSEARALLERVDSTPGDRAPHPPRRSDTLELPVRVHGESFEVSTSRGWRSYYIKGINFGVAEPGRYPSEFPRDSARYLSWLATIASLHANTLRVYTILPPEFYRALHAWNALHPGQVLRLLQGVWAELPPGNNFDDAGWRRELESEIERVVDVVHGAASIPVRPGHASGTWDADVSRWTLGYIVGREWEPYAVRDYDESRPGMRAYHGRFLELASGTAMDGWLAAQCDHLLQYEADRFNALHPVAYTNWPTLDPLIHPTEASGAEEAAWRQKRGEAAVSGRHEYENDVVALDAMLVHATPANPAGWFAAYHAYPYYPDFMINDPGYGTAHSREGASNYYGYLVALRRHHAGIPVVVAEYGVPSSRGVAHLQPQGWNHGGHDEQQMGAIDARLTRDIHGAGLAGGVLFSWMDEWFKHNWVVIDFEIPAEHTRQWSNAMDAEQHYGLLGEYAGADGAAPLLGGRVDRWRGLSARAPGLRIGHDEAYVYLALDAAGLDWHRDGIEIGIDTYRSGVGQHRLPRSGTLSPIGFEFVVDLLTPDSATLRVTPDYNRYAPLDPHAAGDDRGHFFHRPASTVDRSDGRFDSLVVITNRSRFGRDGTFFPARSVDRGRLRYGTSASTLDDWYYDSAAGLLELRVPWDLLNVTDPSTRSVLDDRAGHGDFATVVADSFHFLAVRYDKATRRPISRIGPAAWTWSGWTAPTSHARLKPAADSMRAAWETLP